MIRNSCLYVLLLFFLVGALAFILVVRWAMGLLDEHKEAEANKTIPAPRGLDDIEGLVQNVPTPCLIDVPGPCRDFTGIRPPERHGSGT